MTFTVNETRGIPWRSRGCQLSVLRSTGEQIRLTITEGYAASRSAASEVSMQIGPTTLWFSLRPLISCGPSPEDCGLSGGCKLA
jgi:hypothetical protein